MVWAISVIRKHVLGYLLRKRVRAIVEAKRYAATGTLAIKHALSVHSPVDVRDTCA